jgi:hypothetical protein
MEKQKHDTDNNSGEKVLTWRSKSKIQITTAAKTSPRERKGLGCGGAFLVEVLARLAELLRRHLAQRLHVLLVYLPPT